MGLLDKPMRGTAATLISLFGASVTYRRITKGRYDPVAQVQASSTTTDYSVKATPPEKVQVREHGETVLTEDLKVTVAGSFAAAPPNTTTDWVVLGSTTYKVVQSEPVYAGDQVAAYELTLRR